MTALPGYTRGTPKDRSTGAACWSCSGMKHCAPAADCAYPESHRPRVRPPTLNLTAAARILVVCHTDRNLTPAAGHSYEAALDLWEHLTGLSGDAALAYAREVAVTQTTAVVPPF